ncbi:MAG: radical SAM protein [Thermodesulfobacteriota bacterium]
MTWKLKQGARRLLAQESGTIFKEGAVRVALIYPNTYHIGTSNLGFQLIYRILNHIPEVSAERFYFPDSAELKFFESGTELFSLETQRPISQFDVLAFSIPFEGDYINVLKMLRLAKLPLRSEQRTEGCPLVIAGGMVTLLNPEPLAPFIDAFVIGEGEEITEELFDVIKESSSKAETLKHLSRIEGVYVPGFFTPAYNEDGTFLGFSPSLTVKKRFIPDLDPYPAGSTLFTKKTAFSDMHLIEVSRGCGGACRFCAEGFVYRYPRHRSKESIINEIQKAGSNGRRVGLISPMLLDHPDIKEIIAESKKMGVNTSLSSLRADRLDEDMLRAVELSGQKTLTIAPEAGTDTLRRSINKHFTNEDIIKSAALAFERSITNIKLYFLLGLPMETDDDIRAIGQLGLSVRGVFTRGKVTIGVNPLVPKPWTPFQWAPFPDVKEIERKYKIIKEEVRGTTGIKLALSSPRLFYIQSILSRGSRRVGALLELALDEGGSFPRAMRRWDGDPDFYSRREPRAEESFPWDFIDHGISKKFLRKEYEKSFERRRTPECVTPICKLCGVC